MATVRTDSRPSACPYARAPAARRLGWPVVFALLSAMLSIAALPVAARTWTTDATIGRAELPKEARETLVRIHGGGPFPHDRDGVMFGNRERFLPARPHGYYHEYTVDTPGMKTRGARRIICGGPATAPDACWYTQDHYQSFMRIRE